MLMIIVIEELLNMMLFNIKRGIHYIYDQRKGSIHDMFAFI